MGCVRRQFNSAHPDQNRKICYTSAMKLVGKIVKKPLFWIFLLALFLRLYRLEEFPVGFHVDEIKVGWNALSILKTGKDDHGQILAPYYNSFGDFRPTGIFYFTIPSLIIFGTNEFAVRFPSALFGAFTVFPIYLIAQFVFKEKGVEIWDLKFGYLASILLAISPWHIEVSRATSEVAISTFFGLFAIYFFLKLIEKQEKKVAIWTTIFTLIGFSLYHSIRLLMPVFLFVTALFYSGSIKKLAKKKLVLITLLGVTTLSILIGSAKSSRERLSQVSIFKDIDLTYQIQRIRSEKKKTTPFSLLFDNKAVIYGSRFINEYASYFSPGFLIGNSARPYRYATPGVGLLTFAEIILLILGLIQIIKGKGSFLTLLLLLAAPIPAVFTSEDSPNLHRAFLMLPFLTIIEAYGIQLLSEFRKYKRWVLKLTFAFLLLSFAFFIHMYFSHSSNHQPFIRNLPQDSASYRDVGAKELALEISKTGKNYDKVIVTGFPDNLYPYFAFFTGLSPKEFNKNIFQYGNITFSSLRCPSDDSFIKHYDENILVVDFQDCPYESKIRDGLPIKVVNEITRYDGNKVYVLLAKTAPIPEKFLKK